MLSTKLTSIGTGIQWKFISCQHTIYPAWWAGGCWFILAQSRFFFSILLITLSTRLPRNLKRYNIKFPSLPSLDPGSPASPSSHHTFYKTPGSPSCYNITFPLYPLKVQAPASPGSKNKLKEEVLIHFKHYSPFPCIILRSPVLYDRVACNMCKPHAKVECNLMVQLEKMEHGSDWVTSRVDSHGQQGWKS